MNTITHMLNSFFWGIYNILFSIGMLLLSPYYLLHMRRRGGYWKDFSQRWANYNSVIKDACRTQRIWVHAVSVGECNLAMKFIKEYKQIVPGSKFVLSVNTSTAHAIAEKKLDKSDVLIYFPLDIAPIINKVLNVINPSFIVLTEKEVWPNLVRASVKRNIPIYLINGTISEKSFNAYMKMNFIFKPIFSSLTAAYMQSSEDAHRIISIGLDSSKVHNTGSLKYVQTDVQTESVNKMKTFFTACGIDNKRIITAASTWPGEEIAFVKAFRRLKKQFNDIALIIIPRHVERREAIIHELNDAKQPFIQRSLYLETDKINTQSDVILMDSTGEVTTVYALSSIAFVGKSMFENHGGHNIIEPATFAIPLITGPNTENFPIISQDFISEDAISIVHTEEDLYNTLHKILSDEQFAQEAGKKAKAVLDKHLGAIKNVITDITKTS